MNSPAQKPRIIQAIDAVQCIRSGMDDASLMEKFNLTAKGLQHLLEQLVASRVMSQEEIDERASLSPGSVVVDVGPKRAAAARPTVRLIEARDALECLKAGLNDSLVMKRFNLSAKGLQSLFSQLQEAGLLKGSYLAQRAAAAQETIEVSETIAGENHQTAVHEEMLGKHLEQTSSATAAPTAAAPKSSALFQIRHSVSREVIFAGEAPALGALVRQAVAGNADLSHADLSHANLARLDLSGARLAFANLTKANLAGADLTAANLSGATLKAADLFAAVLYKANLSTANLSGANLGMAQAVWAFFSCANLSEADLTRANLSGANLIEANLFEAILEGTNMKGAYLPDTKLEFTRGTPLGPTVQRR